MTQSTSPDTETILRQLEPETQRLITDGKIPCQSSVINALAELSPADQVQFARTFAKHRTTADQIPRLVHSDQRRRDQRDHPEKQTLILKYYRNSVPALAFVSADVAVNTAAVAYVCLGCSLYPTASRAVCQTCPMVELLLKLENV